MFQIEFVKIEKKIEQGGSKLTLFFYIIKVMKGG